MQTLNLPPQFCGTDMNSLSLYISDLVISLLETLYVLFISFMAYVALQSLAFCI